MGHPISELLNTLNTWQNDGVKAAVGTVVYASGSTPRPLGARMLIAADGRFSGSVSGGCVESAVIQEAMNVIDDGNAVRLHYGITSEMGWEVGLACGGKIDVLVQAADPAIWDACRQLLEQNIEFALVTVIGGWPEELGRQVILEKSQAQPGFDYPRDPAVRTLDAPILDLQPGAEVLIEPFYSQPLLLIIGGVHTAVPLVQFAGMMNYRVVIADPRRQFANRERFPGVDDILVAWPQKAFEQVAIDEHSAIVILTHDPKIDEPALSAALQTDAFYIGAIGSRKTHAKRYAQYTHLGAEKLGRIYGPIGLDIGGSSPEELALSIMAEITAVRNRRGGGFLKE